ncbi:hypothetical protein EVAR_4549_1 [Eumeta japonica]|uniref:Uncharacterized protein n=1 Tax=Eumeta variegata TaxID=151549 RepID=A0A4C1SYZ1_EUMVA|nr:hypothetical protein EVAR_4549_1 [Eumeta japonica]
MDWVQSLKGRPLNIRAEGVRQNFTKSHLEGSGTTLETAAVKLVTKAPQWRKVETTGRTRKGRIALDLLIASFAGNSERQSFVRCIVPIDVSPLGSVPLLDKRNPFRIASSSVCRSRPVFSGTDEAAIRNRHRLLVCLRALARLSWTFVTESVTTLVSSTRPAGPAWETQLPRSDSLSLKLYNCGMVSLESEILFYRQSTMAEQGHWGHDPLGWIFVSLLQPNWRLPDRKTTM